MRLDNLIIEGMFLFDRRVTLPARDLPRGLIAIVGPNGEGKTAMVEATVAAIHREFPSKPNELPHYATRRGAFIEADWTLDEAGAFRARLNIDPITRKVDATLSQFDGAAWRALNDKGMVSTFDPLVRKLFPSFNVLMATAFASQSHRGSFSDMGQTDRKKLFAELLGLEQYERWAAGCQEVLRAIDRRRAELMPWVARLRQETAADVRAAIASAVTSAAAALADAVAKVATVEAAYQAAEAAVTEARAAAAAAAARQLDRTHAEALRLQAVSDLNRVVADRATAMREAHEQRVRITQRTAAALAAHQVRVAGIETDDAIAASAATQISEIRARAATETADLRERIRRNQEIQADAPAVQAAVEALAALEASRAAAESEVEARERDVDAAERRLSRARDDVRTEAGWPERLAVAEKTASLIARVPFGEKCAEAKCEFVAAALDAQRSVPDCRAGVARLEIATAALDTATAAKTEAVRAREAARARGAELRATIARDYGQTRDRAATLALAADRIAERQQQIAMVDRRVAAEIAGVERTAADRRAHAGRQRAEATAEQARLEAQGVADQRHADEALTNVLERLQGLEQAAQTATMEAAEALAALATTASADAAAAAALETAEARVRTTAAARQAEAESHGVKRTVHEGALARQAELATRVEAAAQAELAIVDLNAVETQWRFLATAFGRDGLPNLEIDAAGPRITQLTNDLMRTCFGEQRFTIEIVTQQAKVKGGLKESFEMLVYDGRMAGKPRDLGDLSTGQRVLVDEAVKCALAIDMNNHTRAKLRTCFRDETTGNLHTSFITPYVQMLRRVRELGAFDQLFFITHNPAAAAMADAQVVVEHGTVTIVEPPYDQAALAGWDVPAPEPA